MPRPVVLSALAPVLLALLASCSESKPPASNGAGTGGQGAAGGTAASRPSDPRALLETVKRASEEQPAAPTTVADVVITPPPTWVTLEPSSGMRAAEFRIDGTGGSADVVVYFFGPGQGGNVEGNIQRWVGQFQGADGGPTEDHKSARIEVPGLGVTVVEARGTYLSGMPGGPTQPVPDSGLYGVIIESPGGPVFIKATGPAAVIDAAHAELDQLARGLRLAS